MKFNKELDENAVPEWKEKYLNYKQGKKKLKAVARAIRSVDRSPLQRGERPSPFASLRDAPVYSFLRGRGRAAHDGLPQSNLRAGRSQSEVASSVWERQSDLESAAGAPSNVRQVDERSPLHQANNVDGDFRPRMTRYGSIIGSPPEGSSPAVERLGQQNTQVSLLELPDPALNPAKGNNVQESSADDPSYDRPVSPGSTGEARPQQELPRPPRSQLAHTGNAYEIRQPRDGINSSLVRSGFRSVFKPQRVNSSPMETTHRPPFMQRVLSIASGVPNAKNPGQNNDVALEAYRELDFRQAEFFLFLDRELEKIEEFYKEKEEEAIDRLKVLREQLHIMRNQRLEEVEAANHNKRKQYLSNGAAGHAAGEAEGEGDNSDDRSVSRLPGVEHLHIYRNSVVASMDNALNKLDKVRTGHVGKTSKAMRDLGTPPSFRLDPDNRDYTRRAQGSVPYRAAKRKLKAAFVEYYRGLELLKSYALLNHTAFRKITKKCDKTIPEDAGKSYMIEKVNRAQFVSSQSVDGLMNSTEDYYSRYFERGNRKMAISKLRAKGYRTLDYTGSTLRTGFLGGAGLALAIDGLVHGVKQNFAPNPIISTDASYLLQIYAGYFFLLLLMGLFCFACREFRRHKVNYVFIFEFDSRHNLDWRQLAEMPALFLFLLGLIMDLNFNWIGGGPMYIYWPVVLVGATAILLACPLPIYFHRSRKWFLESLWRVFLSGLYPVEFRDLFFGDIFCSATYTFGNIELFFCLYDRGWKDAPQCNSSHSTLFGFFTTIPGIMRALQCLRRFIQTRNAFPHLANFGKYTCTILSYVSLSLFRLHQSWNFLVLFITFSTINSLYCSVWDIIMDMSLGDVSAKWPLLRKQMLFPHIWWYYGVLILDPILRFNWVFYVIFAGDSQHSTIVSFSVALSEAIRRGIWALFRVENEQCANNRHLIAAREPPIPYSAPMETVQPTEADTDESPVLQTLKRVGSTMSTAHVQDYVRRRPKASSMDIPESDDEDE